MKLLVRAAIITLVFAGAVATAFTPKSPAQAGAVVTQNSFVVSSAIPIPGCEPDQGCI